MPASSPVRRAEDVAAAVAGAGFGLTQLNLSSVGLPPSRPSTWRSDLRAIGSAFVAQRVSIWGLSATYNVVHPDLSVRYDGTARAQALIGRCPELGAGWSSCARAAATRRTCGGLIRATSPRRRGGRCGPSLDQLLAAAERAGVRLGIEPEAGNVVADARRAHRLLEELGPDSRLVGIVLDPANLVTPSTVADQDRILRAAFDDLGAHTVALHAKDVVTAGGYAAAGLGSLDYDLVFALHAGLPRPVPVIIQDATQADVPRARAFLLDRATSLPGSPADR